MNEDIFRQSVLARFAEEITNDIAINGFGASTASTSAPAPLPPLTADAMAGVIKALETPKPMKGFRVRTGIKVIADKNLYKRRVEVYGIADSRRPNNKKMLYRKRTVIIPLMYLVNGDTIICHPSLVDKLRKQIGISDMPYWNPLGYFPVDITGIT